MSRIQEFAARLPAGLDAAIITSDVNRRYLTGMKSSAGVVFIVRGAGYLLIDFRYYERACAEARGCEVLLLRNLEEQLAALAIKHGVKRVGIEAETMTVHTLASYRKSLAPLEIDDGSAVSDAVSAMRLIKSVQELESIKAAQAIAEHAFERLLPFIQAGKSEREIALELDFLMRRAGAEAVSFDTIAVSGKKSALPHGVPGDKTLEHGDFLTLDFGAVVDGYHSDMTRTVALGQPSEEMCAVYETVLAAQLAALDAARAGITGKELDAVARDLIRGEGYGDYFGHGLGHGVGLEIHESPSASPKGEGVLRDGMVVTVEPGIYLAGKFGVRIEDMVVIREGGCENLTNTPKKLMIL